MKTVSFSYARRRDPTVTDPTQRYELHVDGKYYPPCPHRRYRDGDRVRVLSDECPVFSHHCYKIGRILTVREEVKYSDTRCLPYSFYYRFREGDSVISGEELEPE